MSNMSLENKLLNYLIELDTSALSKTEIAEHLATKNFLNSKAEIYTIQQVSSLLHSCNSILRARNHPHVERCGIDRSKNPCGDASDY